MARFGIQLYSVKDEIKEYGLDTVLAEIKAAGYDSVEFAGFYDLTPAEMKATLEKHGLNGVSAHMSAKAVIELLVNTALDTETPFASRKDELRRMISSLLGTDKLSGRRREIPAFLL